MAINLISREEKKIKRLALLSKWSNVLTTLVLVAYVVGLVWFSGWWLRLVELEKSQTAQEQQLTVRLGALAESEIVLRQIDSRLKTVQGALNSRVSVSQKLKDINNIIGTDQVQVSEWLYEGSGQTLIVLAESPVLVENFLTRMKGTYSQVKLDYLKSLEEGKWEAKVSFSEGGS